jgi:hypothetical protein
LPVTTYAAVLVAVPTDQIDHLRDLADRPDDFELVASRVETCPHDLTSIELFPLGQLLAEAIDIGQPLRNDAWHPLRAPIVVDPETVMARARKLEQAVRQAEAELGGMMAEVLGGDIDKVVRLYAHASARGEAVVSFLATSGDDDRPSATPQLQVRVGS